MELSLQGGKVAQMRDDERVPIGFAKFDGEQKAHFAVVEVMIDRVHTSGQGVQRVASGKVWT